MLVWTVLSIAYIACLAFFAWKMRAAPYGYEDDSGFHFGAEPDEEPQEPYTDRPLKNHPGTSRKEAREEGVRSAKT